MSDAEPSEPARAAALQLLAYRPRSESEMRTRVRRRFPAAVVEDVLPVLKRESLLDDVAFASQWRRSRESRRPRSAAAIRREPVCRGVARDGADEAVRGVDDAENVYRASERAARRWADLDLPTLRRKLWGYLRRRGFVASVSLRAIARLGREGEERS